MIDLREHWAEVQRLLRAALAETSPSLDARSIEVVDDYLDHNELELALRSMHSAAEEQNVTFAAGAMRDLKRAAFLMRLEL